MAAESMRVYAAIAFLNDSFAKCDLAGLIGRLARLELLFAQLHGVLALGTGRGCTCLHVVGTVRS
jgi:hypothetical protein